MASELHRVKLNYANSIQQFFDIVAKRIGILPIIIQSENKTRTQAGFT